jgi:hypothetical protein
VIGLSLPMGCCFFIVFFVLKDLSLTNGRAIAPFLVAMFLCNFREKSRDKVIVKALVWAIVKPLVWVNLKKKKFQKFHSPSMNISWHLVCLISLKVWLDDNFSFLNFAFESFLSNLFSFGALSDN